MADLRRKILSASLLSLDSSNLVRRLCHYLSYQLTCYGTAIAECENSFPVEFAPALVSQDAVISSHWIDEPHFLQESLRGIQAAGSAC